MNIENTINDKGFFDSNNFTARKNPMIANLYKELVTGTDWGRNSNAITALQNNRHEKYYDFYETLNDAQRSTFDDILYDKTDTDVAEQTECFIRGFKLAIRLMHEGLTV